MIRLHDDSEIGLTPVRYEPATLRRRILLASAVLGLIGVALLIRYGWSLSLLVQ